MVNVLQATELCTSVGGLYGMWTISQESCNKTKPKPKKFMD